jgi:cell division protein ZapA
MTADATDKSKQPIRVNIFNQVYTVVTAGDPNDTLAVAHEVDELMNTIARRAGNLDSTRAAVLACLHLADRLRVIEKQLTALRESVDQKSRNISELLNKVIPED